MKRHIGYSYSVVAGAGPGALTGPAPATGTKRLDSISISQHINKTTILYTETEKATEKYRSLVFGVSGHHRGY